MKRTLCLLAAGAMAATISTTALADPVADFYKGKTLNLSLGFSHPVAMPVPEGLSVSVTNNTMILIEGIDKAMVGQFAADVRSKRPPEPYKGKGIRYLGEHVRRKVGKTGAA